MKLSKVDLAAFKQALLALRSRLRGDISQLAYAALNGSSTGDGGSRMPIHMAEVGTENFSQEFSLNLMANDEGTLDAVESALERLEDGRYGLCQECGKPIAKMRLQAIPYAPMCITCAQATER